MRSHSNRVSPPPPPPPPVTTIGRNQTSIHIHNNTISEDVKKDIGTLISLCRIKYGNLDKDVDEELTRIEDLYIN